MTFAIDFITQPCNFWYQLYVLVCTGVSGFAGIAKNVADSKTGMTPIKLCPKMSSRVERTDSIFMFILTPKSLKIGLNLYLTVGPAIQPAGALNAY